MKRGGRVEREERGELRKREKWRISMRCDKVKEDLE